MILYLDTSSLVKLYVTEVYSGLVRSWAGEAEIIATCRVAYPEMISALNRRFRTGGLSKADYALLLKTFTGEWRLFAVIDFDEIAVVIYFVRQRLYFTNHSACFDPELHLGVGRHYQLGFDAWNFAQRLEEANAINRPG